MTISRRTLMLGAAIAVTASLSFSSVFAQQADYSKAFPGILMDKDIKPTGQEVKPVKKDNRPLKVGFLPTAMDTYYQRVLAGVKEEIDKRGGDAAIHLLVQAPSSQSATDDQIRTMEAWINDGVDAIAVALYNEGALLPSIRRATEAGIPVFLFNSPVADNPYYVSDIGYEQSDGGRAQAQWLVDTYGDKEVKVGILEGLPGPHTSQRMKGFNEIIEKYPNFKIVAKQPAGWVRAQGLSVTENMFTANPDIEVLVALYDEMALGGLQALKAKGLNGKVAIVGYENMKEANDAILTGDFSATVDTGAKEEGRNIIRAVDEFVMKGNPLPKKIFVAPKTYDAKNIKTFDQSDYVYVPQQKM
ncbi:MULTISPECIES: sugar ABC transporter substrate-binding protein [Rhizobium/Agrobacterium group]|uniref:sugar ABC transporter substrate-binding protein n=1 Tax=Rhizobium/Agrobacterium group TaxID=227290 RepID=UPI0014366F9B|nr:MULTISPECIES: sugar ABC transporter substrate-binding protein [Rhizobium/Agrobacterium group]MBB4402770.1 ribose transport system substrate-binding protein [Agrobacterium radiobacter]MBB5589319.1 ribose transport system substrate-binding protein [Agrobacterium radiobacter]